MRQNPLEAYLQGIEAEARHQQQAARERVHQAGLACDSIIVEGIPFQAIVDLAGNRGVDLTVMGTHGRTGLSYVLLGSVAEKVLQLAPCAVLVTRGAPEPPARSEDATPAHP